MRFLRATLAWFAALGCVLNLFPIVWMAVTSFKAEADVYTYPPRWAFRPTLDNYRELFGVENFLPPFINSLVVASASTALALVLGSLAAYGLARYQVGGKYFPFWILSTRIFPPMVVALPVFFLITNLRLLDTRTGLSVIYLAIFLPFVIWLMRGFLLDIPLALEEAALIDGCNRWQAMVKVVLPLAGPGLAVTAIFTFIAAWNEFLLAIVLTGKNAKTAPVAAAAFASEYGVRWGPMMAAGVVILVPMILAALAVQRYIVRGLTLGAVKG